ncbi:MAG: hypothetical protein JWQ43_2944 [Glaciihabitans sp.]|nr:hypothetical protein [Glaciihabitans sp.]
MTSDTPADSLYTDGTVPADADFEQGDTKAAAESAEAAGSPASTAASTDDTSSGDSRQ